MVALNPFKGEARRTENLQILGIIVLGFIVLLLIISLISVVVGVVVGISSEVSANNQAPAPKVPWSN